MGKRLILWTVPMAVAAYALIAGSSAVFAYPTPQGSASLVSGCATLAPGGSCDYTFKFLEAGGSPAPNLAVSFTARMDKGCSVSPSSGTTGATGLVSTTLSCTAKANTGTATITAKSGKVSASATVTIAAAAVPMGAHLPFGNASPASTTGTNPAAPWGLIAGVLAAAVVLASSLGGFRLVRGRRGRS